MDLREVKGREGKVTSRHPWELARVEVIKAQIKSKFKTDKLNSVLDLGCGDTFLVEELARAFPHIRFYAVDIEFTDDMITEIQPNISTQISLHKNLNELNSLEVNNIDLVLLLDVIEHIEDDISFMKWVNEFNFIKNSTDFLITVPAYQSLFCSHDDFLGHYRRYTNKNLKENLSKAGYATQHVSYFFWSLLPVRILQVLIEKFQNQNKDTTGLVEWEGGAFKTKLLTAILLTDYKIGNFFQKIGLKIPGLSNIAICRPLVS